MYFSSFQIFDVDGNQTTFNKLAKQPQPVEYLIRVNGREFRQEAVGNRDQLHNNTVAFIQAQK